MNTTTTPITLVATSLAAKPMCFGKRFLKGVAVLLSATMLNMTMLPLAQAVQQQRAQEQQAALTQDNSASGQYADLLAQLKANILPAQETTYASRIQYKRSRAHLPAEQFEALAAQVQQESAQLRQKWEQAGVDPGVIQKQQQLEASFAQKHQELMAALNKGDDAALATFVRDNVPEPTHHNINLDNMPWQVEKATKTEPAATAEELNQKLGLSSAKTKTQARALQPPTAADLAATLDAPQTADIKALAQSLDNNPHKIYQWVHDNIHYFPSHGSVQGAQDTLDKKRGNAFDTNSLLIALLRSAGIPARYVYGTVEIPVEKVMNWVGGAETADEAQQIISQGGVPNTVLVKGGKDFAFRMEHVWVEALLQYHPGRGTTHIPGQSTADTWVPMDGSFKQYTFAEGMDLEQAVPIDAEALMNAAQQGAEINEAEGWVRGLNTAALEQQLKVYQNQLGDYIESQNGGQSTVGDVLGMQSAQIDKLPYLAGSLPYTIKARSQQFGEVPDAYRAKFRYRIFADQYAANWGDSPLLHWQTPTASIAGKKVTIAWVAANEASQKAIEALIPTPKPGEELKPEDLPKGLSSSIALKPEIRVDGQTVATGPGMGAGSEPIGAGAFTRYGTQQWDETTDQLIAGQQTALGISIQGVSAKQMETLKTRMEQTKATLEQAQAAPQDQREAILKDMTGESLTGDMLTATIWGYFAGVQNHGVISGAQAQTIDLPALSYGMFHAQVKPRKIYGIVTTGMTFQGLNMDIGHMRYVRWVKNDDPTAGINSKPELTANGKTAAQNRWIAYNKMRGQYVSAMEHAAPEAFWVDRTQCKYTDENGQVQNPAMADCAQAISAVKAIAIAQQQGQKIYTINKDNRATALPKLTIGGAVGDEIRAAINAGKEVTFHEKAISAHGWTGYGYIIIDPETGAGAYLIEGGGNGAILLFLGVFIIGMLIAMAPAIIASGGAVIAAIAPLILLGVGCLLMGLALLDQIDRGYCKLGLGLIVGTSLAFVSSTILIPAIGAAAASTLAGFLHLIAGTNAMRGIGAAYAYFVGPNVCQE